MRLTRLLVLASALAATALVPTIAQADGEAAPDPAKDPQVARLLEAKKTLNWNHALGANKDRYGHAEALVEATADQVAKTATEFGKYRELHRKFKTARVVGKEGNLTDVYMRYPVQIGPMTIELYEVMRFQPDRTNGGTHTIEAHGIKGDMKRGHTIITVKPVDAKHSLLTIDVLLVPTLPAPQSYVDEELRDGAEDFVNGIRDRSQPKSGPVVSL
ncbi:MAG: hypothetical protein JWP87_5722 [Labilithrix sp.]|nr:hypothetical protein [Labilithrix sp.]